MEEIWKQLPYSDGKYYVSNLGRIKSMFKGIERIMTLRKDKLGYIRVSFFVNNRSKGFLVHRLVALAFVPNPNKYTEINHIDGNKENNVPENLEWCTRSHNVKHAFDMGLKVNKKGSENCHAKSFNQFDLEGNFICRWGSIVDCAKFLSALGWGEMDIIRNDITSALSGRYKTTCGYIFSFNSEVDPELHKPKPQASKAIIGFNSKTGEIITFESIQDTKYYKLPNGSYLIPTIVCKCLKGKRKKHGGFEWKYRDFI